MGCATLSQNSFELDKVEEERDGFWAFVWRGRKVEHPMFTFPSSTNCKPLHIFCLRPLPLPMVDFYIYYLYMYESVDSSHF